MLKIPYSLVALVARAHTTLFFSLTFCLLLIPQIGNACLLTQTFPANNGFNCIGSNLTFTHGNCSTWTGYNFEWQIERCTSNGINGNCNNNTYAPYTTVTQSGPGPLNFYFWNTGNYRIRLVIRDPITNVIVASPCSATPGGPGNCSTAIVNISGVEVPYFEIDPQNCSYDRFTNTYTQTVTIDPRVNFSTTQGNGTTLNINWGDGNTQSVFAFSTGDNIVSHTYSWQPANNQNPNFNISVTASNPPCPSQSYTRNHRPIDNFNYIIPQVIEENCDEIYVCFDGLESYNTFVWYDSDGQFYDSENYCVSFQENGTYTLVANASSGCPLVFNYTVSLNPNSTGVLYSNSSYLQPGSPLDLNVNNTTASYITYEINSGSCTSPPIWIPFATGNAGSMANYTVPGWITQSFLPCMLNSDFQFCIRANVACDRLGSDAPSSYTNEICFDVCAARISGGGNGTDRDIVSEDEHKADNLLPIDFNELEQQTEQLTVFPNPVKGQVNIMAKVPVEENVLRVRIISLNGQLLYEGEHPSTGENFNASLELPDSPPGAYILKVFGKTYHDTTLLVIE